MKWVGALHCATEKGHLACLQLILQSQPELLTGSFGTGFGLSLAASSG